MRAYLSAEIKAHPPGLARRTDENHVSCRAEYPCIVLTDFGDKKLSVSEILVLREQVLPGDHAQAETQPPVRFAANGKTQRTWIGDEVAAVGVKVRIDADLCIFMWCEELAVVRVRFGAKDRPE